MPRHVDVDQVAARVDQEHGGCQAVETVRKRGRLEFMEVDDPADCDGAAKMRRQQANAPFEFVIKRSVSRVSNSGQPGEAGCRFLDEHPNGVSKTLRSRPLFVEARFQKFVEGYQVAHGLDFSGL